MKKIAILFSISFFIYSNVYSQSDSYWSSNTKNYLVVDSTTVLIKTNNPIKTPIRNTNFQNISGLNIETKYLDSTHVFLQALNKISLNNISTGLTNQNLKATDLLYAYTYNKSKIIPTGTIVLKNKKGVSIEQIINLIGGSQIEKYHSDQYGNVYIIQKKLKGLFQLANTIYESGLVEFCHPDFICYIRHANVIYDKKKAKASSGTNDAYYNNQYYLKNTGQNGSTSGVDINIEDAWALPSLNAPVRVAVIDDGVESHEDLAGKLVSGYTTADPNVYGAPEFSTDYHGQACAGIIAATKNNGIGISGISNAVIVPINIFYYTSTSYIANGINWAWSPDQGNADILSCSWGGPPADIETSAITNAINNGRGGKGAIVVVSAGNFIPNNVPIGYPASVPGVIAVGAIDKNNNRWNYSPNSPSIVAPSGDLNGHGDIYMIDRMGYKGENSGNYLSDFGGTSAACPQVAGVAALILAANPTLTGSQVKNLIINNATPMYNATNFGAGRLNAYKALSQAILPVSGVSAFCSSAVYTATNVTPGLTVTWSVSPAGIVSMTPSGNQVTLTKLSQGFFTLTATLSGVYSSYPTTLHLTTIPDCTAVTATMSGSCNGSYQTWFLSATPNMAASNWHWTVDNPSSASYNIFNPYAQSTYVSVSGGGGGISVTYTDPCGETSYREGTTIYSPCARKYAFVAYPNPANGQLSIKLNNEAKGFQAVSLDNTTVSEGNTNFIAELYDGRGRLLKKSQTQNNESELTFNTSDLTNGTYYLHIKSGTDLIQKQVIIHH